MKIASQKHDLLWYVLSLGTRSVIWRLHDSSLSDADTAHFQITPAEKADFLEEVTTEMSVYLGMMYHLIEIFKERDDFADELSGYYTWNASAKLIMIGSEHGSAVTSLLV
jgi:hypothetical protein